jgi:hypothetical protein
MQLDIFGQKEEAKKPSPKEIPKLPPKLHHLSALQSAEEWMFQKARPYAVRKFGPNKTFIENL